MNPVVDSSSNRLFLWVVRHLRGLARVPGLPQLFDALLLGWVGLFHRPRLAAMELLETEALRMGEVRLRVHRFGGIEFHADGYGELGHVHGHGLLDVSVGLRRAEELIEDGHVRRHHVFPHSRWISFQLKECSDVPYAVYLLETARQGRRFASQARHSRRETRA